MTKAKALSVNIYKPSYGDCSNHGISSKYDTVLIISEEGIWDVDLDNPPENLCEIVERELWGKTYRYVCPVVKAKGVGWLKGGCIVDSSDSRWSKLSDRPLHLYDRDETQEEYDRYSR